MIKIKTFLIVAAIAAFTAGCSTTGSNTIQINPQSTAAAIHAIVPPVVRLAVAKEPKTKQWIIDAQFAVCSLSMSTNVAPANLKAVIESTGIEEAKTPEVEAAIEAIYGLYTAYYSDVVKQKLNTVAWCGPVLTAICDSLTEGLATP